MLRGESPRTVFVPLHDLKRLPELQMRAGPADEENMARVREIVESGGKLPPCEAVSDGRVYWLTDGNMRTTVLEQCDKGSVECVVYPGTFLDAQMRALRANSANGCGRTDADRRKAILALIDSPSLLAKARQIYVGGGIQFSIATACGVSISTVKRVMDGAGLFVHHGEIIKGKRLEPSTVCANMSSCHSSSGRETIAADYGDEPDDDDDTPIVVEENPGESPAERARREAVSNVHKLRIAFAGSIDRYLESLLAGPLGNRLRRSAEKEGYPIPDDVADWLPLRALRRTFAGVKI